MSHEQTPSPLEGERAGVRGRGEWIISVKQDLIWLQGSALAGVALLLFFVANPSGPIALLGLLLWGVLFDGTHVMGTVARTYLAPDPGSKASLPGAWSWSLLLVGPA